MRRAFLLLAVLLLIASTWIALTVGQIAGPPANPDSLVRNILYAHLPGSVCALLCFTGILICSIGYLTTSKPMWDTVAAAAAEVGIIFATILNATGMIFSKAEWGTWWTPSPRLIWSAVLWFQYIVYLIIRSGLSDSKRKAARICAVFGIIAFLDVPMIYITARLMPDMHRADFGFDSNFQTIAMALVLIGTLLLAAAMIWLRADMLKNKDLLEKRFS